MKAYEKEKEKLLCVIKKRTISQMKVLAKDQGRIFSRVDLFRHHVSDEGKVTFLLYLFSDQTPAALVQMKMILADQLQRCTCFKSTSRHQTNVSKYFMKMNNFVWM